MGKNILPSDRTSEQKTKSFHLFNVIAVVDRVIPKKSNGTCFIMDSMEIDVASYIPSVAEQKILLDELTIVLETSVIGNLSQFEKIYKGTILNICSTNIHTLLELKLNRCTIVINFNFADYFL